MSLFLKLFVCSLVLVSYSAHSDAVSIEILQPIRLAGDEVALIFIPGAQIKGEAYKDTAYAIQRASQLRLWVALTGNYTMQTPNPLQLPTATTDAISALQEAGMKGNNYVGIAHSLGGVFLGSYAKSSPLRAIVLLGAYLNRNVKLQDYPIPVLTLSGELDGQTRITRVAVEYKKLQVEAAGTATVIYRTPVINIKGSSHSQFASGPMPYEVRTYDIRPDVTITQAHAEIGRHVNNFLTSTFTSSSADLTSARLNLTQAFNDSKKRFQPLLDIKLLDVNGSSSPWAISAQKHFAEIFANRTQIKNRVEGNPMFSLSRPTISPTSDGILVTTRCFVDYPLNPADVSVFKESPVELDIKMKSTEAIGRALHRDNTRHGLNQSHPNCRSLNEVKFELFLQPCDKLLSLAKVRVKAREELIDSLLRDRKNIVH